MTDTDREERLITALEAQANAITRLVQVLEGKAVRKRSKAARRVPAERKAIEVTPMVEHRARLALAKLGVR